jgi:RHS repeat-associated protein
MKRIIFSKLNLINGIRDIFSVIKINFYFLLVLFGVPTDIIAQSYPGNAPYTNMIINTPIPANGDVIADCAAINDITVIPGPSSTTIKPNSRLYINSDIQLPIDYNNASSQVFQNIEQNIDQSLDVGSIFGQASVNLVGAAKYLIPINLPSGTGEMTPALSLEYNSDNPQSNYGRGWQLNGLQMISRIENNLNNNNYVAGVTLTNKDRFAWNGNILLPEIVANNGLDGTIYHPQFENFSKIISHGGSQIVGPDWFEVITKEGLTIELGNTTDSKIKPNGCSSIIEWYVNKVVDRFGNYMLFEYYLTNGNDIVLKNIKYSGNDATNPAIVPTNQINFYYALTNNTSFRSVAGYTINQTRLLQKIEITVEGAVFSKYYLTYNSHLNKDYLVKVEIENGLGAKLNPTIFQYENESPIGTIISVGNINTLHNYYSVADINNDGRHDIIKKSYVPASNLNIESYLSNSNGANLNLPPVTFGTNYPSYAVDFDINRGLIMSGADFNSDGMNDFLFVRITVDFMILTPAITTGNQLTFWPGKTFYFSSWSTSNNPIPIIPKNLAIRLFDYNGDSYTDIFICYGLAHETDKKCEVWSMNKWLCSYCDPIEIDNLFPNVANGIKYSFEKSNVAFTDNKLKSDLINIYSVDANNFNSVTYYGLRYNDLTNLFEVYNIPSFMDENYHTDHYPWYRPVASTCLGPIKEPNDHLGLFGDYNGDGFTDLISDNTIHFSSGSSSYFNGGIFNCEFTLEDPTDPDFCTTNYFLTHDINKDGKDDVIEFNFFRNAAVTGIKINYSNGTSFNADYIEVPVVFDYMNYEIGFADFDGDGKEEIYFFKRVEISTPFYVIKINKSFYPKRVVAIIDGLDNKTSFTYGSIIDESMRTGNSETPIIQFGNRNTTRGFSKIVVKSLKENNGVGGDFITEYKYDNPISNLQGDGFLGFQKTSVKKLNSAIEILTENTLSTYDIRFLYPITEKIYNSSIPLKLSTTDYSISQVAGIFGSSLHSSWLLKREEIKFIDHLAGYTTTNNYTINNNGNTVYFHSSTGLGLPETEINTTFDMDPSHRNTVPYLPLNETQKITLLGQSNTSLTTYSYNGDQLLEIMNTNANSATKKVTTGYTYFPVGMVKETTTTAVNALQKVEKFEYDPLFKYNHIFTNSISQEVIINKHPLFDLTELVTNESQQTTSATYDGWGRELSQTLPNSNIINIDYEWVNFGDLNPSHPLNLSHVKSKTTIDNPGKPFQETYYDELGRVILTSYVGFSGDKIFKSKQYNSAGLVFKETNNYQLDNNTSGMAPIITTYIYDSYNRVKDVYEDDGINVPKHTVYSYTQGGGNTTTSISLPDGSIKSIKIDAAGRKIQSSNDLGTVQFTYSLNTSNNTSKKQTNYGISTIYDELGNPLELIEPAGTTNYIYNGLGQLLSKTDPKNANFTYTYNLLGNIKTITGSEGVYEYNYVSTGNGINQLENIHGPFNSLIEYTYNNKHLLKTITESNSNNSFVTEYEYNQFDDIKKIIYPGGLAIDQIYNSYGYLNQINRTDNQALIWKGNEQSPDGNFINFTLGNNKTTIKNFSNFSLPFSQETMGVENNTTNFDNNSGNLISRSDLIKNHNENFVYDKNRLFGFNHSLSSSNAFDSPSDNLGRLINKFDAGEYTYYPNGAVKNINPATAVVQTLLRTQEITNTPFNKIKTVHELIGSNEISLTIDYGPKMERTKGVWKKDGNIFRTRFYANNFELTEKLNETTNVNDVFEVSYIYAPTGLCAIFVKENGIENMNYIYTDYLGSINKVFSTASNNLILERNYDAWGRERNTSTLAYENSPNCPEWLSRGYEGHEMLNDFALINMNGRVYDPVIGQFLSPDPVLQDEDNPLNYNKYIFVFNNPLKYVDPTGMTAENFFDATVTENSEAIDDMVEGGNTIRIISNTTGGELWITQEEWERGDYSKGYHLAESTDKSSGNDSKNDGGNSNIGVSQDYNYAQYDESNRQDNGSGFAMGILTFIGADVAVLEPSDAFIPKWIAYGILGSGASLYLYYNPPPILKIDNDRMKGGKQPQRDKDYGIKDPGFIDWWHNGGGKQGENYTPEDYQNWKDMGSPRGPRGSKPWKK